jgi:cation:H+ antiporter
MTRAIGDHVVTMTLAFIPLTIIGLPIGDLRLFWVTPVLVALMPALYAALIHWGAGEHGFKRWQVAALPAMYAV